MLIYLCSQTIKTIDFGAEHEYAPSPIIEQAMLLG